jgi:hypothetical protein
MWAEPALQVVPHPTERPPRDSSVEDTPNGLLGVELNIQPDRGRHPGSSRFNVLAGGRGSLAGRSARQVVSPGIARRTVMIYCLLGHPSSIVSETRHVSELYRRHPATR